MRALFTSLCVLLFSFSAYGQCNPASGNPCPGWASASPSTGFTPLIVSFNASPGSSGDVNTGGSWGFDHWDFGDGQTSSASLQTTHTYTAAGNYQATVFYKQVSNYGLGVMCGNDGGCVGDTFETFSTTVTVTQPSPITSLSLTPSTAAMLVGDTRTLALADQNGNPVPGAAWMIDNTAVLSL